MFGQSEIDPHQSSTGFLLQKIFLIFDNNMIDKYINKKNKKE